MKRKAVFNPLVGLAVAIVLLSGVLMVRRVWALGAQFPGAVQGSSLSAKQAAPAPALGGSQFRATDIQPSGVLSPDPSCIGAEFQAGPLPFTDSGTTIGGGDDYSFGGAPCAGGGSQAVPGTGVGPDVVYMIMTDRTCTLAVSMDPTGSDDLALYVERNGCFDVAGNCAIVDDAGGGGVQEDVEFQAAVGMYYYVIVDGYNGASGPYDLTISEVTSTGCQLVSPGSRWTRLQKLTAAGGAADDGFGSSVALAGDTALVGASADDVGANVNQGSATVFVRSGTIWTPQAYLTAADGAEYDVFGTSVALSADGNTALVGARQDDVGANDDQGSATVFVRNGTGWTQQAKLTAADGAGWDRFGTSVALSADGNTALVGASTDDVGANGDQGSAYVFVRSGTAWTQQAHLTASDGAGWDMFGNSVALSGNTALVGALQNKVGANDGQGSAYVFVRSGTTWTPQAKLTASDGAVGEQFGSSVALAGDTALVGAWYDQVGANNQQGSAYVFTRSGTTWTQRAKLTAADGAAADFFGFSVALSGDADTALVGEFTDDVGANGDQGSAYVFVRSGTAWTQQAHLVASDGAAGDYFGISAALSGDTALVGAVGDDIGANADQGSAYFYKLMFPVYLPLVLRGFQ